MRRLGVFGENLEAIKSNTIVPSDFLIAGLIAIFPRRYDRTYAITNEKKIREIFGNQVNPLNYGWDSARGFLDNVLDSPGTLYIKSHVGNNAGSIDGVASTSNAKDGADADVLQLDSAYEEELDYSTFGDDTGYTVTQGARFTTAIKTAGSASDTSIVVDTVSGVRVGDIIKVVATAGGGATVYKKVTSIDESTGTIGFADAFHGTASVDVDDVVTVEGFQLQFYRKSATGVETKVETELGKIWCTLESEVTEFFVENVFSSSKYVKVTYLDPATAIGATYMPATVSTVTYLSGGSNGTAPTTQAHWDYNISAFANNPIRLIANCETTDEDVQKSLETHMKSRWDTPKVLYNIAEDRTKSQLITIGNRFQRGDDVMGVISANWLKIPDPFATSVSSPKRHIPNVGHMMGLWIRSIYKFGIHWIPALAKNPLYGISGVVGYQALDDEERTELADAGINMIQETSNGIYVRNWFTPSTDTMYLFGNGILMRDYIQVSIVDSLKLTENEPNSYNKIQGSRSIIVTFFEKLWKYGSTGKAPEGETFGQTFDPETNEASNKKQHFKIQADFINNPQANISVGERNYDTWFTYPSPAGSIKIGVGLMSFNS